MLYTGSHNNTSNTPTWKDHHRLFAKFITNEDNILEIGGSGVLYNLIKINNPTIQYSCLDICDPSEKLLGITYLKGNCENFTFPKSTIVMSHVFEHLYNPRKFIENIHNSGINSIYISIPNMASLLESNTPNVLHNEHTFYIDTQLIEWLFAQYNYRLVAYYEFKSHSLFFHFKKNIVQPIQLSIETRPEIKENISNIFMKDSLRFKNIKCNPKSFITPAGLYGQFLAYSLNPSNSSNIIGFLDNDTTKHNKRVYGTPYYVYPFSEILNHDDITIYILAGPYKNELISQIQSYKTHVTIVEL